MRIILCTTYSNEMVYILHARLNCHHINENYMPITNDRKLHSITQTRTHCNRNTTSHIRKQSISDSSGSGCTKAHSCLQLFFPFHPTLSSQQLWEHVYTNTVPYSGTSCGPMYNFIGCFKFKLSNAFWKKYTSDGMNWNSKTRIAPQYWHVGGVDLWGVGPADTRRGSPPRQYL